MGGIIMIITGVIIGILTIFNPEQNSNGSIECLLFLIYGQVLFNQDEIRKIKK